MLLVSTLLTNAQLSLTEFFKSEPVINTIYDVKLELTTVGSGDFVPTLNFKVSSVYELYCVFETYSSNYDDADVGDVIFSNLSIYSKVQEFNFQNADLIIAALSEYNPEEEHFDYLTEETLSDSEGMYTWLVGNGMKKK